MNFFERQAAARRGSTWLVERLNRDELQGVIAHEFGHILNGDMRLNIRLIGVLFGILVLALIGRKILEHGRFGGSGRNNKGAGAILIASLVAMVVGYVGLFFGRLIKAGVSARASDWRTPPRCSSRGRPRAWPAR